MILTRTGGPWRVPSKIVLPFGFVIKVRAGSAAQIARHCDDRATDACFDFDTRTIWLQEGRDERDQLDDLAHEMIHAVADWQVYVQRTIGVIS